MQPAMREKMQRNVSQMSWLIAPSDYLQTLTSSLRMSAVSQRCNVIGDRLPPSSKHGCPEVERIACSTFGWAIGCSHYLHLVARCEKVQTNHYDDATYFYSCVTLPWNSKVLDSIIHNMHLIISMSLYKKYFHPLLFQKGHHSGINFTPNVPDAFFPIPRFGSPSIIKQRLVHS